MTRQVQSGERAYSRYGSGRLEGVSDQTLLEFGRALGGEPREPSDLPFTPETTPTVRHDERLFSQVPAWLETGHHVTLCDDPGAGKTVFYGQTVAELEERGCLVTSLAEDDTVTPRHLRERLLRRAHDAGYGVDPADYWQVDRGVPWRTEEIDRAVWEVTAALRAADRRVVLAVDDCGRLSTQACETLCRLANSGVGLLLVGRPRAEQAVDGLAGRLPRELHALDGVEPFDAVTTKVYITQTLAGFTGGETPALFGDDIIEPMVSETDGTPRAVRELCFDLFGRAADLWQDRPVSATDVTITRALVTEGRLRPA